MDILDGDDKSNKNSRKISFFTINNCKIPQRLAIESRFAIKVVYLIINKAVENSPKIRTILTHGLITHGLEAVSCIRIGQIRVDHSQRS